jgi:hypothetical protein
MAYDNSGIIGKNKRKQKDNHPDIQGQATVNGVEYWISGWQKNGSDGIFYSLSFKPKEAKSQSGGSSSSPDLEDEIPF